MSADLNTCKGCEFLGYLSYNNFVCHSETTHVLPRCALYQKKPHNLALWRTILVKKKKIQYIFLGDLKYNGWKLQKQLKTKKDVLQQLHAIWNVLPCTRCALGVIDVQASLVPQQQPRVRGDLSCRQTENSAHSHESSTEVWQFFWPHLKWMWSTC